VGSVLTLTGTVGRAYQREEAERAMAGLVGIKGIVNSVRVEGGAGDARAGIEEALKRSALVDASHVKVHVTGGVASLRGTMKTRAEWEEAMRAAWAGPGVVKVEDHLAIG
jgi:osmotically-inducible protein OsmY